MFLQVMQEVTEGKAVIEVPTPRVISRDMPVFYNPKMEMNRTLSVAVLQAIQKNQLQIALPLAGSGIRGIRFVKELPYEKISQLCINDNDEEAVAAIQKNIKKNQLEMDTRIEVTQKDAEEFLQQAMGFDYIDIDPFGSPNFLLDLSIKRLSRESMLAVTATDTGALAGSFPNAGKIKYWAMNYTTPQKHELGLRILARKVILVGLQYAKALRPVFSYHDEHYYRVYFQVEKSKTKAAELFDQTTGLYAHCPDCAWSASVTDTAATCSECTQIVEIAGPLYTGPLQDKEFVALLQPEHKETQTLLDRVLREECGVVGFYDTHEVAQKQQKGLQPVQKICDTLIAKGFVAVQAATQRTGVKTNAPFAEFVTCLE